MSFLSEDMSVSQVIADTANQSAVIDLTESPSPSDPGSSQIEFTDSPVIIFEKVSKKCHDFCCVEDLGATKRSNSEKSSLYETHITERIKNKIISELNPVAYSPIGSIELEAPRKETKRRRNSDTLICPICFADLLKPGLDVVSTFCGHIFCSSCIPKVVADEVCPCCRTKVSSYHSIFLPQL